MKTTKKIVALLLLFGIFNASAMNTVVKYLNKKIQNEATTTQIALIAGATEYEIQNNFPAVNSIEDKNLRIETLGTMISNISYILAFKEGLQGSNLDENSLAKVVSQRIIDAEPQQRPVLPRRRIVLPNEL